jgi:tetratricopeptide (TPR) repeat protein
MRTALLLLLPLLLACTSQRKRLQHAARYEQQGLHEQAFVKYEELLQRKPANVDALAGMKRTAQHQLDRALAEARGAYFRDDLATGDRLRQEAIAYRGRMDRKGLALTWDALVDEARREAQLREAARLFEEAEAAFRADRFADAEELATRSLRLDPGRREYVFMQRIARLEPLYRQGLRARELGLWRDAFRAFKQVTDVDPGYKDAWNLAEEARGIAQVVLAYVPLVNRNLNMGLSMNEVQLEGILAAAVKQAILDLKDPLLVLVDRDNTAQLLAEQQRQMSGVYDDRYVVDAGKLMGARYVITCRLLRYDEVLKREVEVQAQLIDAESGRIHLSEIVRVDRQEIGRGNTRSQLLERAGKRIAARLAEFDPHKR